MRILLTDISSYKAISFLKALINTTELEVFTSDYRPYTKFLRTKYSKNHFLVSSPITYPDEYLSEILNIVNTNKIDFVIPANSEEIRLLLKNRSLLGNALKHFGEYETFLTLDDKKQLEGLATKLKIKIPK